MKKIRFLVLLVVVVMSLLTVSGCEKDKDHEYGDLVPSKSETTSDDGNTSVETGTTEDETVQIPVQDALDPDTYVTGKIDRTESTSTKPTGSSDKKDDDKKDDGKKEDDKKDESKKEDSSSSSSSPSGSNGGSSSKPVDIVSGTESTTGKWSTGWIIPQN